MKQALLFLAVSGLMLTSCGGSGDTAKTFCDTTCVSDSLKYVSNDGLESKVSISFKNCVPDSVNWTHGGMAISRTVPFNELVTQDVRLNKNNVSCVIRDTSHAWLTFNDCITGRGFLYKLPFNKANNINKITSALNAFDPKFVVSEELRAYTDRGSIFVINIRNGKEDLMTFKETYDIDFNKVHEVIDSINVSPTRIYVKLLKQGQPVELNKKIDIQ